MAKLKDIAEKAGVSVRTVTRALQENGPVNSEKKKRILAIARKLGYRPNRTAQSLKTGKKYEITVIISTVDELTTEKIAASEAVFRAKGLTLNILFAANILTTKKQIDAVTEEVLGRRPAGVILFAGSKEPLSPLFDSLKDYSIPFVVIDPGPEIENVDIVGIDRKQGVYESIHNLAEKGYKKIAYLGSRLPSRLDGYYKAIKELGRKPILLTEQSNFEAGRKEVSKCLKMKTPPDAIQAYTDYLALGFLAGMNDHGLKAPEDFAVVGFDNRSPSSLSSPPLTTVAQPNEEVGRKAAEIILQRIRKKGSEKPVSINLPTKLVERETT